MRRTSRAFEKKCSSSGVYISINFLVSLDRVFSSAVERQTSVSFEGPIIGILQVAGSIPVGLSFSYFEP